MGGDDGDAPERGCVDVPVEMVDELIHSTLVLLDQWHIDNKVTVDPLICAAGVTVMAKVVVGMLIGHPLAGETMQ